MKLAIMLSGTGTTYGAIANAINQGRIKAQVDIVIASKKTAGGIDIARDNGHEVKVINPREQIYHDELNELFTQRNIDLVVMAGFMHLWELSPKWEERTINIHPALIPAFCGQGMYGHHVHKAAIEKGVKFSGCTVHKVDRYYDHGKILEQRMVSVESQDTPESLAAKVGLTEKSLLLHVIANWEYYKST
ncbi:MAG: phosphoribosylglycinamide formyltransferase [Planctomycetes bacterium]|nr:phosphoribosylglycinamide formyltransferase [Planctomycetota bacterium]